MRRGFWFAAGAGAGAYAVVRARRMAEVFTADGLSDRWHALTVGARMFRDEVAQGQAEAEYDLRERFGLVPHGLPELVGSSSTTTTGPPLERHHDEEGQS
ncbi:DUF6167 family protein [Nocardioides cynanchi]|uniref:DUF6167 family protein n=1 Tax=Nocardioides cynanchi TaxID=2558918 RepID=UPI00177EA98D|nr:DUF6167 family protein [Nocardioides cynanchi]